MSDSVGMKLGIVAPLVIAAGLFAALPGQRFGSGKKRTALSTSALAQQRESKQQTVDWQRVRVGPQPDGSYMEATAQLITPAGKTVTFFGRPTDLALDPGETVLAVKHSHGLAFVSVATGKLTQDLRLPYPGFDSPRHLGGNGFHGIMWQKDGRRVWTTDAWGSLHGATRKGDGTFVWTDRIALPGPAGTDASAPGGLAWDDAQPRLYVTLSRNNSLGIVNLATRKVEAEIPAGISPYAVLVQGTRAFVTNWGGRRPLDEDFTGPTAGSEAVIDPTTGVASVGTVSVVDLKARRTIKEIEVGLHPSGMAFSTDGRQLFVANANSDTASILDTEKLENVGTIQTRPRSDLPLGSAPNALAVSPDGRTLFVANGGNNAIAAVDIATRTIRGSIPVGWYPDGIAISKSCDLFVANLKGLGNRASDFGLPVDVRTSRRGGYNVYDYAGAVSIVAAADVAARLQGGSAQVAENMRLSERITGQGAAGSPDAVPVPLHLGEASVFKHVLYIIKENRTYDQVLGDLPRGNGDSTLTMFGAKITPNHHALASEFVLLDNFYCNGVLSADGHQWTDEGYATDYIEKSMGGFARSYPADGTDALAYASSGFIWDAVLRKGLKLRVYGEFLKSQVETEPRRATWNDFYDDYLHGTQSIRFFQKTELHTLAPYVDWSYPAFSLRIPDVYRAREFIRELHGFEKQDDMPSLMVMQLGNDHTSGTDEGLPTPRTAVADNDLALGQIVEAVSKSKFWRDTVIFIVEDDPQDGLDHVDGHRTVAFAISAYTRRGFVDSTFYNQNSILRTIELILGLDPMTQFDLATNPILASFEQTPDFSPYVVKPNHVRLDEINPKVSRLRGRQLEDARLSKEMNFDEPDKADDDVLNRILWHAMKGYETPYPER
jgi:YVTN family beta-propeller protein